MDKYLLIKWSRSDERVEVELRQPVRANEIQETTEYHIEDQVFDTNITTSTRQIQTDGSQTITIRYAQEYYTEDQLQQLEQKFGPPNERHWGTSTITVSRDLSSAGAKWQSHPPDPDNDGPALRCTIFPRSPGERERQQISRIKRQQEDFRNDLHFLDRCCAITGENTRAALDAAHIVAVADGGLESSDNGILLRADLHRLYDAGHAGLFEIAQDGSIICISDELSNEYKALLQGKKVSDKIVDRIRDVLAKRTR